MKQAIFNLRQSIKKNLFIYFFGVFFAITLLVNIFFIYISQKTWQGVFVEDSYKRGLNYDKVIEGTYEQPKTVK